MKRMRLQVLELTERAAVAMLPQRELTSENQRQRKSICNTSVLNQCHLVLMCSPVAFLVSSDYKSYLFHHWQSPASNLQANQ